MYGLRWGSYREGPPSYNLAYSWGSMGISMFTNPSTQAVLTDLAVDLGT